MSRLEKTKEFNRGAIQELLQNGIYLMDLAYQTATNFRADAKSLLSTYHRIPAEARHPQLKETIEQLLAVTSSSHLEEFLTMKETLTQGLNKLLDDLPAYDTATSQTIREALMMTKDCTQMVQSIRDLIPLGKH